MNQERQYPSLEEVETDGVAETQAINICKAALIEAMEPAPLDDLLKVYALLELAVELHGEDYAGQVLSEIAAQRILGVTPPAAH